MTSAIASQHARQVALVAQWRLEANSNLDRVPYFLARVAALCDYRPNMSEQEGDRFLQRLKEVDAYEVAVVWLKDQDECEWGLQEAKRLVEEREHKGEEL